MNDMALTPDSFLALPSASIATRGSSLSTRAFEIADRRWREREGEAPANVGGNVGGLGGFMVSGILSGLVILVGTALIAGSKKKRRR